MFWSRNNNFLRSRYRYYHYYSSSRSRGGFSSSSSLQPLYRCFSQSSSSRPSTLSSFLAWYSKKLDTHPYMTKGITSGIISFMGDLTCQYLTTATASQEGTEEGKNDNNTTIQNNNDTNHFDYWRSIRFFIMGTFWVAPITNFWYRALSTTIIPGKTRTFSRVAKRLALDQFVFAPIFVNSFMAVLWTLENEKSFDEITSTLQKIGPDMVIANWSLWIPAMTINFSIVPLRYQVLFGNVVAIVWTVYLSWMSSSSAGTSSSEDFETNSTTTSAEAIASKQQ